jgi:4-diphosphocytidyl-2-C-methyl-D-erythritol kinase
VTAAKAYAKINLALVVGPPRPDGLHAVSTLLQRIDLHDDVELEPAEALAVEGFGEDTLVRHALATLAAACGADRAWRVRIEKRIPVAAGLGGGSSDAAAALRLAHALLDSPLSRPQLDALAASVGSDVPFFLRRGTQLATGSGTNLVPVEVPQDYTVLVAIPNGEAKESTAAVYRAFDARSGAEGFDSRVAALQAALSRVRTPVDLAELPSNDLAGSPLAGELVALGAFRADVSGAGPAVYGLFEHRADAEGAAASLRGAARTWIAEPVEGP